MEQHLSGFFFLPSKTKQIKCVRSVAILASLVSLLLEPCRHTVAGELATQTAAALFAADEDVLSENTDVIIRRASEMSIDQQFDYLAKWVLPSNTRMTFRMKATFVQTDGAGNTQAANMSCTVNGIRSPVFALIDIAGQANRLEELRLRIKAMADPREPHELRAKMALLFMIDSAKEESDAAATSLLQLAALVRTRQENLDGRWWPETLALAYGMRNAVNQGDMLELATSIYDPQIGHSIWSGHVEWDLFIAGCFAKLQPEEKRTSRTLASDDDDFAGWIPTSAFTAESRGKGHPNVQWQAHGDTIRKVGGHNGDFLYLPVPLTGNFEIMCDVTSYDYRETSLAYGGQYVQHYWSRKDVEIGTVRHFDIVPLAGRMTEPDPWISSRIKVQDGVCTHYLNGREMWQRTLPAGYSPWVALRAFRLSRGSFRNLAILGAPVVPKAINLSVSSKLDGWYSYFDESIADPNDANSWQLATSENVLEMRHQRQPELAGTATESLLMYHRPMIEDGVIEYDFFYEPDQTIVHPALDRMVFLLHPDGVRTHWVTDGKWQRDPVEPGNVSVEPLDSVTPHRLNLLPNAWNHVELSTSGETVELELNGTKICRANLPNSNSRQFGFFHYADESNVLVRNVRWAGDWRMTTQSPEFPESSQADVTAIERATAALPEARSQKLIGLERFGDYIIKRGGPIEITKDGIVTSTVSTGRWLESRLPLWLNVSGDFDIQASFNNFEHGTEGEAGLQLRATLNGSLQEIFVLRNAGSDHQQKLKVQTSVLKSNGQRDYFDKWSTSEIHDGTLRLVRLGTKLYYLMAENDSGIFRLLGSDEVASGDLRLGDFCLSTYADKNGTSKVTWTNIRVRATRISGDAIPDLKAEVNKLYEQRLSLRLVLSHDFTRHAPDAATFYRWADVRPWNAADGGLLLKSAGADTWQSAGISTQMPVTGDFDMRIEFDSLNLAIPGGSHQSGLHFQIDPVTNNQTELNSMIGVAPTGVIEAEGYSRSKLPNGNDEYRGTERHVVPSATALRIVRRGKRYLMLVRSSDENDDRIVSITENTDAPIRTLRVILHTGGAGRESSVRLKRLEIYSAP